MRGILLQVSWGQYGVEWGGIGVEVSGEIFSCRRFVWEVNFGLIFFLVSNSCSAIRGRILSRVLVSIVNVVFCFLWLLHHPRTFSNINVFPFPCSYSWLIDIAFLMSNHFKKDVYLLRRGPLRTAPIWNLRLLGGCIMNLVSLGWGCNLEMCRSCSKEKKKCTILFLWLRSITK